MTKPQQTNPDPSEPTEELSGGFVNYYLCQVTRPQRQEQEPYQAECDDIIAHLGMTFAEGCAFKAIWRTASKRKGRAKKGHDEIYDAQKVQHYGKVMERMALLRIEEGG